MICKWVPVVLSVFVCFPPCLSLSHGGCVGQALQLTGIIARDQERVQELQSRYDQLNLQLFTGENCTYTFQILNEMLGHLELMISRHKLDSKAHFIEATTKWLQAKTSATCSKLR